MDEFFYNQSLDPLYWLEPEPEPEPKPNSLANANSAFKKYENNAGFANRLVDMKGKSYKNVNKRLIELLRRMKDEGLESKEVEKERCYKHMISERMRREKQRLSYSALRNLLPVGTKNDKKTIVQVAANEISELENYKEELERRKREIEATLTAREKLKPKTPPAKIRLRVSNPTSGIDSMLAVLKRLKNGGSTIQAIHSTFSDCELSAILEVGPEVEAAEVEKFVEITLLEVERKHPFYFPI